MLSQHILQLPLDLIRPSVKPLPQHRPGKGRTGDMAKYYSTPGSKYTGRACDENSLARHQAVYYAQAHICEFSAEEALNSLMVMFEPQSLAGSFCFKEIFQKSPLNLEAAF